MARPMNPAALHEVAAPQGGDQRLGVHGVPISAAAMLVSRSKRMTGLELDQWIPPAVIIRRHALPAPAGDGPGHGANGGSFVGGGSTAWSLNRIGNLRDRMNSQITRTFDDRTGRSEFTLDDLRAFLVGVGRGTAAGDE